ncbi:hypothetical protein ACH42_09395 [Endozoicomonas sp. (ex Bugula neritina AB1)]|nr:hypothetical protein ACH42_09395 [Endozoicomonas sp. (ex Bugula neritina AB1)]
MEKFRNLDIDEYLDQQEREKISLISTNKKREKGLTKTRSIRNKIIAYAQKEKKGKGNSKAENIKLNRREEKGHERRTDAKRAEQASGLEPSNKDSKKTNSSGEEHKQIQDIDAVNIVNDLLNKA